VSKHGDRREIAALAGQSYSTSAEAELKELAPIEFNEGEQVWPRIFHYLLPADRDPAKLRRSQAGGPALEAGGGRFLVRGVAAKAYESGQLERTVG